MDTILAIGPLVTRRRRRVNRAGGVLSNVVASQVDLHREFGGVFPEMASREHDTAVSLVLDEAVRPLPNGWGDVQGLAVTHGPGLAGSLLVGVNMAKGLAYGRGLPLLAVNHILSHIYANWLLAGEAERGEPV